ncbi:MAG: histidinol dehydrogenase [Gemmatimonadaceae bacterium]|nr:histidinol dehydrogenase [Gemmatimonadaceae bacterium]
MSDLFRWSGSVAVLSQRDRAELADRSTSSDDTVRERTAAILRRVRADGDAALLSLATELDGVSLRSLEVPRDARIRALELLDAPVRRALERAARNIEAVHRAFLPRATEIEVEPGIIVGRRPDPLDSVGVYAPGGRAAYPSSVLMGAVPARVAGVSRVILCSPPGPDGLPSAVVLAAAELAGVSEVYAIGGAGAIAAMTFGTTSIAPVRRIVGPGNAYVAEAKLQVSGVTGIDSPAGPSELLVIADDSATPTAIARELLAQAEHDPRAAVVAIARDEALARAIGDAVEILLRAEPRREIITQALATRGALLWERSLERAIDFANEYAPEHLLLALQEPDAALASVRNAGTVFLGSTSSVAFGDYMTGANHVLPTGGLARSYSGLSTLDFVRWTTYQRVSPSAAADLAASVATLAASEGLPAHAAAARRAGIEGEGQGSNEATREPSSPSPLRARTTLRALALYTPNRAPCALDLSDNTNRWGMPPSAERALRELGSERITRYPSVYAPELKSALADYAGVDAAEVVTGCGSDDILDSTIRAYAGPGDTIAFPDPTFGMLPIFAQMNGLVAAPVPTPNPYALDIDALLAVRARVTYLCSPNNPTGLALSRADVARVVEHAAGIVILDEAYAEFAGDGWLADSPRHPRLIVARTMSKAFGLAGLRIGYATAAASTIVDIEKARGPYMVSAVAERAALAALRNDLEWVRTHIEAARESRVRFTKELAALGIASIPSEANFVFVPVSDAAAVAAQMRAAGVAVRPFPAVCGIGDGVRITVAPWPMMDTALEALRAAVRQ